MLTPHKTQIAIATIDRSGAAQMLHDALVVSRRGRPRQLTTRAFLVAGLLTAMDGRLLTMTELHHTLTSLDPSTQEDLGIRVAKKNGTVSVVSLDNVEYMSGRIKEMLSYTEQAAANLTRGQRTERLTTLIAICDALVDATLIARSSSTVAIDATGVWAWAKGPDKPADIARIDGATKAHDLVTPLVTQPAEGSSSADPEAAWGAKTRKDGHLQAYYGYELHAAVNVPSTTDEEPTQIQRLHITHASEDVVDLTLGIIDRMSAQPGVTDVLVDRHYSYKSADRWAQPLRARGVSQHLDLRKEDQGFRDHDGIRMAAGWAHCPATPDHLGTIPRPGPGSSAEKARTFHERIKQRETYAMRRVERPTATGRTRWMCPAEDGRLGCPLRDGTEQMARERKLPIVVNPPAADTAPKCCTQRTVAIKESTSIKLDQPNYWGSKNWQTAYQRRTYVEGFFGSLKAASTRKVGRGQIQVHGLARTWLLVTLAVAATNIHHARRWHDRTGQGPLDHPLLTTEPEGMSYVVTLTPEQIAARDASLLDRLDAA